LLAEPEDSMLTRQHQTGGHRANGPALAPESEVPMREHPKRRIRLERGIYYRSLSGGKRRYEITFLDSSGRRRWQVVDGGLEGARRALRYVHGRKDRGERVDPTKIRMDEFASAWLLAQTHLRPGTRAKYEYAIRRWIKPTMGRLRVQELTEEHVLGLITAMRRPTKQKPEGLAPWTIHGVLIPLGRILRHAARRGLIPSSPMSRLERGERPSIVQAERRILTTMEVTRLIAATIDTYRPAVTTAAYTGLRLGELLGLRWRDIDFDGNFVRMRGQIDRRTRERVPTKTPKAVRDVPMIRQLRTVLLEHRAASPFKAPDDPVFAAGSGRPLHPTNVGTRGVRAAAEDAGLDVEGEPPLTMHTLRRTFASHLILDLRLDPVQVSRVMGHAKVSITLDIYADLFDQARNADTIRNALADSAFGNALETLGRTGSHSKRSGADEKVAPLQVKRA